MPSAIEWTDETWNPVTGCTRVSPGCDHCYMFAMYPRLTAMGVRGYELDPQQVQLLPERLHAPLRWGKPRRVFVNSMSDVFHPKVPFDFVTEIFDVMCTAAVQRGHIFQVLTKRPGRAVAWWDRNQDRYGGVWPAGVWIGTSVENQKYAPRITVLARLPAPVRFVSAEPLLGAVDLRRMASTPATYIGSSPGGESGRSRKAHGYGMGKRLCVINHVEDRRRILSQAVGSGIAKQASGGHAWTDAYRRGNQ